MIHYRKKISLRTYGFTLIELLLLIVVLAVLASLLLASYQQRTNNLKIEKTAIQIQQILQAASAYWGDKNIWPSNGTSGFDNYLPLNSSKNPWNGAFSYGPNPNNPTQFQVSSGNVSSQQNVKRLISLLPNATQDPSYRDEVIASVNTPGTQTPQSYLIQQIGATDVVCDYKWGPWQYCRQGKTFYFACPSNWKPQVLMSTEWMNPSDVQDRNLLEGSNPISTLGPLAPNDGRNPGDFCVPTSIPNYYQCNIRAMASTAEWNGFNHTPNNLGLVTYTYIAYCIPTQ